MVQTQAHTTICMPIQMKNDLKTAKINVSKVCQVAIAAALKAESKRLELLKLVHQIAPDGVTELVCTDTCYMFQAANVDVALLKRLADVGSDTVRAYQVSTNTFVITNDPV